MGPSISATWGVTPRITNPGISSAISPAITSEHRSRHGSSFDFGSDSVTTTSSNVRNNRAHDTTCSGLTTSGKVLDLRGECHLARHTGTRTDDDTLPATVFYSGNTPITSVAQDFGLSSLCSVISPGSNQAPATRHSNCEKNSSTIIRCGHDGQNIGVFGDAVIFVQGFVEFVFVCL